MRMARTFLIALSIACLLITACGRPLASEEQRPETVQRIASNTSNGGQVRLFSTQSDGVGVQLAEPTALPLVSDGETFYVPLLELVEATGYLHEWDERNRTYQIGFTDPIYEIRMDSTQVLKEEQQMTIPKAAKVMNGAPYLPLESFERLFQGETTYAVRGNQLILQRAVLDELPDPEADVPVEEELDFAEDPHDPAGEEEAWTPLADEPYADPVLKNINVAGMLSTARNYLGVKYKFGANAYSSSHRYFDCSSYTRFIFNKYGVSLPRTARAQAKRGTSVSRKNLRKGDLLFFYVPGRFKTNKTVGHVGIYIGNQNMIHASPEPKNGVQITNIDKAFWKKTFLSARRVAY